MPSLRSAPHAVPRLTADDMHDLAVKMFRNEVYLMWADERDVALAFPVISLARMRLDFVKSIGAVYAPHGREGGQVPGRAVNGRPIFFSAWFVHRKDCAALMEEYERIQAAVS